MLARCSGRNAKSDAYLLPRFALRARPLARTAAFARPISGGPPLWTRVWVRSALEMLLELGRRAVALLAHAAVVALLLLRRVLLRRTAVADRSRRRLATAAARVDAPRSRAADRERRGPLSRGAPVANVEGRAPRRSGSAYRRSAAPRRRLYANRHHRLPLLHLLGVPQSPRVSLSSRLVPPRALRRRPREPRLRFA